MRRKSRLPKTLFNDLPWHRLQKGQGFFIPCLDLEDTMERAKIASVFSDGNWIKLHCIPCVVEGMLGISVFPGTPRRRARVRSGLPSDGPPSGASPAQDDPMPEPRE